MARTMGVLELVVHNAARGIRRPGLEYVSSWARVGVVMVVGDEETEERDIPRRPRTLFGGGCGSVERRA